MRLIVTVMMLVVPLSFAAADAAKVLAGQRAKLNANG